MFRYYKAQTPVALQIKKMGNQKSMTPCFNLYGRIFLMSLLNLTV